MTIDEFIEVLIAAKNGEEIEFVRKNTLEMWRTKDHEGFDTFRFNYRIAPKKEMTLVERARQVIRSSAGTPNVVLICALADRIEELEDIINTELMRPVGPISNFPTDELLKELKWRIK
jgi:hypothetical protein